MKEMLRDYFLGVHTPVRYWQRYKDRLWLHFGIKPYPGLREKVLKRLHDRQRKLGARNLKGIVERPNPFLKLFKNEDFKGSHLPIPINFEEKLK